MNVAVLTTQTLHHCYFVRELSTFCPVALVLSERNGAHPSFETRHPFEDDRDAYERRRWFGGSDARLDQFAPTIEVRNLLKSGIPSFSSLISTRSMKGSPTPL